MSIEKSELIAAVKSHALEHYEESRWDVVVGCYSDEQIAEVIGKTKTCKAAIKAMQKHIKPVAEYWADIQGEAF